MAYIILFFLMFILNIIGDLSNRSKIFFSLTSTILLIAMASLRINIGTDYENYIQLYDVLTSHTYIYDFGIEPFFYLVNILSSYFEHGPMIMFFIMSVITVIPFFVLSRKYSTFVISIVFLTSIYLSSLSLVRQMAAASILLLSANYLLEGKIKKSLFFVMIASSFHYSSLLFIGFIIFRRFKISAVTGFMGILILYICINIINLPYMILTSPYLASTKYGAYAGSSFANETEFGSGLGVLLRIAPIIITIVMIYFERMNKRGRDADEINLVLLFNYAFIFATMLAMYVRIFNRLSDILAFVPIITLGVMSSKLKLNKFIFVGFFIFFMVMRYFVTVFNSPSSLHSGLGIYPYEWIL